MGVGHLGDGAEVRGATVAAPVVARRRVGLKAAAGWVADRELWWILLPLGLLALVDRVPFRWVIPVMVPVAGVWIARWVATGHLTVSTPLDASWALVLAMSVVALYPSVDSALSRPVFLKLVLEAILFYQVVNAARGTARRLWMGVALLLLIGTAFAGLSAINTSWTTSKIFVLPEAYTHLPRLLPWLNPKGFHPNIVGGGLAMVIPVTGALVVWGNERLLRGILVPLFLGFSLVLILSQSRGALVGTIMAAVVAVMLWRPRWAWFVVPISAVGLIAILQFVGVANVADFLLASEVSSTAQGRLELWSRAIYMLQDFPYTGIGIGTFSRVAPILYPFFLIGPDTHVPHTHNLYLQAGVNLGLPGLVAFIALLVGIALCAVHAVRNCMGNERALAIGLTGGFVVYLIHGLVDHITFSTEVSAVMWIISGLIVALANRVSGKKLAEL